jgi:hypothetical protein
MWDQTRDIRLLRLDVATTIGPGYDEVVTDTALRISALTRRGRRPEWPASSQPAVTW